jgi:hypothetical protein
MVGVVLRGFMGMMGGMQAVGMRHVGVVPRLLMLAGLVVLGGLAVMMRRILVMLGCSLVVIAAVMRLAAHVVLPDVD